MITLIFILIINYPLRFENNDDHNEHHYDYEDKTVEHENNDYDYENKT